MGGRPFFPDGDEPDGYHRGGADDDFASVVLDEDFVRAAVVHEPTAVERMVAAAEARAEAERTLEEGRYGDDPDHDDPDEEYGPYGPYGGRLGPYRGTHWQRPVALLLAVVMGVGIVALAFTAVYRTGSAARDEAPAPGGPASSRSAESVAPDGSVPPR
ncbi:hypothetical protein SRB5_58260 [Streptomyces sp. RB5]|uniref:Uncharacterized protein n=1 Tax=Streptomyces smaragdinus TaxID=2585196 RepID=A0A7K0CQA4_9ACTN|nr:hypothetical protein [Streptomyces smaragdinus]